MKNTTPSGTAYSRWPSTLCPSSKQKMAPQCDRSVEIRFLPYQETFDKSFFNDNFQAGSTNR
jgi:hypothetical protein